MTDLELAWKEQAPTCGSCGWANAFYEIEDGLEQVKDTETEIVYHVPCRSENEDAWNHRGSRLYLPKLRKLEGSGK